MATAAQTSVQVQPDRLWWPATDAQRRALECEADILLFGGAAGSLKSETLVYDMALERHSPNMKSVIFRRTYPELEELIERARILYPQLGGHQTDNGRTWRFPAGGLMKFRHVQHEKDLYQYQGQQYSAMGFDESTHFPEKFVRYLITRNRSVDSNLKIRIRLATNPGNVGHVWHKKLFFNGVCPHCTPHLAPIEGQLRTDAKWPSDGVPLSEDEPITVTYILGRLTDHDLLGSKYAQRIRMQNPATAKALLAGCWEIFEGQYFSCWEPARAGLPMVVPRRDIGDEWWWPRWVGADYGFTISTAAAYLFLRGPAVEGFPKGRIYVASRYSNQREKASDFSKSLVDKWVNVIDSKTNSPYPYRYHGWWLSPDAWADRGSEGASLAEQMNEVLGRYGHGFTKANDDRAGGAMRLFTMLETGEMVICEDCEELLTAIPTRIHDDKHENDVLKVKGDPLDDHYDAWRYGVYSYVTASDFKVPAEVRIAGAMDRFKDDPTNAMIAAQKEKDKIYREEHPVFLSGNIRQRLRGMQFGKKF